MSTHYHIELNPDLDLLQVTLLGFFEPDDIAALRLDLIGAIASLRCPAGEHLSLYDVRECKIQSQQVVQAFRAMSDRRGLVARRIAVVTGSSLMKMQIPRILVDRESACFDDPATARAWLRRPAAPDIPGAQQQAAGARL